MLVDLQKAHDAYRKQRAQAKRRKVEFNISFEDWMYVWLDSGYWTLRGKGKGTYNMSRRNDVGPYAVDNVFIQSHEKNASDGHKGIPKTTEEKLKNSLAQLGEKNHMWGKKLTDEHRQKISKGLLARRKDYV